MATTTEAPTKASGLELPPPTRAVRDCAKRSKEIRERLVEARKVLDKKKDDLAEVSHLFRIGDVTERKLEIAQRAMSRASAEHHAIQRELEDNIANCDDVCVKQLRLDFAAFRTQFQRTESTLFEKLRAIDVAIRESKQRLEYMAETRTTLLTSAQTKYDEEIKQVKKGIGQAEAESDSICRRLASMHEEWVHAEGTMLELQRRLSGYPLGDVVFSVTRPPKFNQNHKLGACGLFCLTIRIGCTTEVPRLFERSALQAIEAGAIERVN